MPVTDSPLIVTAVWAGVTMYKRFKRTKAEVAGNIRGNGLRRRTGKSQVARSGQQPGNAGCPE
ncbi:MAG: hypothetical protein QOJ99_2016 [Bryobacterales bacterium]|jgi:hypothetical protein|nr:hypothetical protein [Bryobacterales bacterium]